MSGDDKFWLILVLGIVFALAGTISVALVCNYRSNVAMMENGYEETVMPGSQYRLWTKAKP